MQVHKVIWQEGMLLRPQHLQHNDRYYHQQLNRTRLLGADAWGFLTLEVDLQYLNFGKVVVNQASGVLPDGSLFELGGAMEPLVLQVPANAGKQPIYLAPAAALPPSLPLPTRPTRPAFSAPPPQPPPPHLPLLSLARRCPSSLPLPTHANDLADTAPTRRMPDQPASPTTPHPRRSDACLRRIWSGGGGCDGGEGGGGRGRENLENGATTVAVAGVRARALGGIHRRHQGPCRARG